MRGKFNAIIRRTEAGGLRVYQANANAMTSLAVDPVTGAAVFDSKVDIQDITNPLAAVSVDGNATLQVTLTDRGEPGNLDTIAITVWSNGGGLWFASQWNGRITVEDVLTGRNLVVH